MALAKVSVIIVNWHSEDLLAQALAALDAQTVPPERVVVVDNGSSKKLPVDRYTRGPIEIVCTGKNEGFAAGNNLAIRQEDRSEYIVLLNPDAVPERDWLKQLITAAERHPEVSAFGSVQLTGDENRLIDGLGDVYHVCGAAWRRGHGRLRTDVRLADGPIFSPCAAAALYRRQALLEVGGFDEDFFCYFEDVDLGFRLRLRGHQAMMVSTAIVRHLGGATAGGRRSDFAVYHGQRNLVWAYFKNMPWPHVGLYLFQHLLFNLAALAYFGLSGQARTILRAKWDAIRGLPRMLSKRRSVQASTGEARRQVRAAMVSDWLAPYRRSMREL